MAEHVGPKSGTCSFGTKHTLNPELGAPGMFASTLSVVFIFTTKMNTDRTRNNRIGVRIATRDFLARSWARVLNGTWLPRGVVIDDHYTAR